MGALLAKLGDPDDLLAFSTPKIVKVRDWHLGALNYALQLGIFVFVCFQIFAEKQYNAEELITGGQLFVTSRQPDDRTSTKTYPYCCKPTETRWNTTDYADWFAADGADCPMPSASSGPDASLGYSPQKPCLNWGSYSAEFPVGLISSTVVTSRVKINSARSNCTEQQFMSTCQTFKDIEDASGNDERQFYVAGAEDFTLLVRHAVKSQFLSEVQEGTNSGDSNRLYGSMRYANDVNKVYKEFTKDSFLQEVGDLFSFQDLLNAVNLGNYSEERPEVSDSTKIGARRYDGMNIVVYIIYEQATGGDSMTYYYQPKVLADLEYKVEEIRYEDDGMTYNIYNRHGIRVNFLQSGKFYEFKFLVLLTTLVTSLALLAVSSTVVNLLMTMVLPMRHLYKDHKYEITEDFSVWRENKSHYKQETEMAKLRNAGKIADTGVIQSDYTHAGAARARMEAGDIQIVSGSAESHAVPAPVASPKAPEMVPLNPTGSPQSIPETIGVTAI